MAGVVKIDHPWSGTGVTIEPTDLKKDTGWILEKPWFEYHNWWMNEKDLVLQNFLANIYPTENASTLIDLDMETGQYVVTNRLVDASPLGGARYLIEGPGSVDGFGDRLLTNGNVARIQHEDFVLSTRFGVGVLPDTGQFQAFVNKIGEGYYTGLLSTDVDIIAEVSISSTINIEGGAKESTEMVKITTPSSDSGFLLTKSYTPADDRINNFKISSVYITQDTLSRTADTSGLFLDRSAAGSHISNCKFEGFNYGVSSFGSGQFVIDCSTFEDNTTGLLFVSSVVGGLIDLFSDNIKVNDCTFVNCGSGVEISPTSGLITFDGCKFIDLTTGVILNNASAITNCIFRGCTFRDITTRAILSIVDVETVVFDSCTFDNVTNIWEGASSFTVVNCKILNTDINLDIFTGVFENNVLENCTFTGTVPSAVQLQSLKGNGSIIVGGISLYSAHLIADGTDLYHIESGSPPPVSANLANGSTWIHADAINTERHLRIAGNWRIQRDKWSVQANVLLASINPLTSAVVSFNLTGVLPGDYITVSAIPDSSQFLLFSASCTFANTVRLVVFNASAATAPAQSIPFLIEVTDL